MQFKTILQLAWILFGAVGQAAALPDIVFVTQPPHPNDFATVNATFGSHRASLDSVPRGGDLYIRYSDGTLKNLTAAAGFGRSGFQGGDGIAVRDPAVHWSGNKILFSMVIGSPSSQYQLQTYRWQLYEVTNISAGQSPQIVKVPNQPLDYNNVMPVYGTDERIIFVSDRPRSAAAHTYPQRDEYESTATNTGLWSLDPANGDLIHLDHSPSGDFSPTIDSFGRVIFVRWDHLQRDQQNRCSNQSFKAFNYASEDAGALPVDSDREVYPEQRADCDSNRSENTNNHSFNQFLPWQMHEDGSEMETINHIGRHELASYIPSTLQGDPNIEEFYGQYSRVNQVAVNNFFQIQEDSAAPGNFVGVSAPEFGTHASGQLIKMFAPPDRPADQISIVAITHPDTSGTDDTPSADHIGLSRDPLPLSDGTLIAAHSVSTQADTNIGSSSAPVSRYNYRLKPYTVQGQYFVPGNPLTSGITKTISYWSPDVLISYNNTTMWELQPREVRARMKPTRLSVSLPAPEKAIFEQAGVEISELRNYLRENKLALIVSRNVTRRDNLDHQQPLNLKVEGSTTKTQKNGGTLYSIAHLQIFQGDLIRAYGGVSNPQNGRRVIAQPLHSVSDNPLNESGPEGSVRIAGDGSMAAFVPAQRAITYQLTNGLGNGVVRERLWLTFQPGEIRVCGSCHGVNSIDQAGQDAPVNQPEALRLLLEHWKGIPRRDPELSLKLSSVPQKKTGRSLTGGGKVLIEIRGKNAQAANQSYDVSLKAGKSECGKLVQMTTNSEGNSSLRSRKLPHLRRKTKLTFAIAASGTILDQGSIMLLAKSPARQVNSRICTALKRSFR